MTTCEAPGDPRSGLLPAGAQVQLGPYLRRIWQRLDFIVYTPLGELRARHMDTLLGNVWHLLNPILSIFVYWLIFGQILKVSRGIDYYIGFLAIGIFIYQFIRKVVTTGGLSLTNNQQLMKSIHFPRAILQLSALVAESLALIAALAVMYGTVLITGQTPMPTWIVPIRIFPLEAMFALGCAFFVARVAASFQDIKEMLLFVFRLLFYASAVLFSVTRFAEEGPGLLFFYLNPIYAFLTVNRAAIMGTSLPGLVLLTALVSPFIFLVGGFWWFRRGEGTYARG